MIQRFRDRAQAVRERPLPPVAGEERQQFIAQAQLDFQDYAMIGDAQGALEDGVLVLRIDLRPGAGAGALTTRLAGPSPPSTPPTPTTPTPLVVAGRAAPEGAGPRRDGRRVGAPAAARRRRRPSSWPPGPTTSGAGRSRGTASRRAGPATCAGSAGSSSTTPRSSAGCSPALGVDAATIERVQAIVTQGAPAHRPRRPDARGRPRPGVRRDPVRRAGRPARTTTTWSTSWSKTLRKMTPGRPGGRARAAPRRARRRHRRRGPSRRSDRPAGHAGVQP